MSAALAPTVDEVVGHTEHVGGRRARVAVILAALVVILMTLGALLLAAALWRAGTVPRWLAVAFVATNLVSVMAPFGPPAAIAGSAFGAVLLAIGWQLWRSVSPAPASPVPTT
jgi:hypothetical protein